MKQHLATIQTKTERALARALHRKKIFCQENYHIQCIQEIESVMARIDSIKNNSSINCDWKETLTNLNIPKAITTKQPINSIEDFFLSMDKKPP